MTNLSSVRISPEVLSLIPKDVALAYRIVPISVDEDSVLIAAPLGAEVHTEEEIAFFLGKTVTSEGHSAEEIDGALRTFYNVSEIDFAKSEINRDHISDISRVIESSGISSFDRIDKRPDNVADGSTVLTVDDIVSRAIRMGASDIHVEPYEKSMRIRYRLDGVLHEMERISNDRARAVISRLKIMAELDIAEKRRPQDGRIRVNEAGRAIDIRVSTLPTDFGEKVVLRILDKSQLQLDLGKLGFESDDLRAFQRTIRLPFGMVLVTGPTGSGKTTTLYAALQHINDAKVNITTIEDPIEYNLAGINQTQVRSEIGVTFSAALRSILRQDPNIIMVGEIRDSETAEIAIRAALTGHLVFSTLHTNDAPSAVTRLIDMGVEPFLVASSVKMILAQRLLRKLCPKCKKAYEPSPDEREELDLGRAGNRSFYKSAGCPSCSNVGYKGRVAVYEMLSINNGLGEMIAHNASASDIRRRAQETGMRTLRDAALKKAARSETSLDEVLRETAA